jgi:hypothetical protein
MNVWIRTWVDCSASLKISEWQKKISLSEHELGMFGCPACSQVTLLIAHEFPIKFLAAFSYTSKIFMLIYISNIN